MNTKKSWSVILLTAIGTLFVTVAGCIFISNTWILLSEAVKKICLAMVTAGLFSASYATGRKGNLNITSKAFFYLASVLLGFTSFMCFDFLSSTAIGSNINALRFSVAIIFMIIAVTFMYIKERHTVDFSLIVILANMFIIAFAVGMDLNTFFVAMAMAVGSILLSVNAMFSDRNKETTEAYSICSKVFHLVQNCLAALFTLITFVSDDSSAFGQISILAILIFASTFIPFLLSKDLLSRIFSTISTPFTLLAILIDFIFKGDFIPEYYIYELFTFAVLTGIALIKIIWYDKEVFIKDFDIISFIIECMAFIGLLFHNFNENELACVLSLGISAFGFLIISTIRNDKKRQILFGIVLFLMVVYLTKAFWLSIAWWVYLFIAGIICFAIAFLKEKKTVDTKPEFKVIDTAQNNEAIK